MAWMEKQLESLTELVKELTRERALNEQQMSRRISTSSITQKGILISEELRSERIVKNLEWMTKVTDDVISSSKIYSISRTIAECLRVSIRTKRTSEREKKKNRFVHERLIDCTWNVFFFTRHQWQTVASTLVRIKSQNKYITSRSRHG